MGKSILQVKVLLNAESAKRFEKIKEHYGLSKDAPVIRILIKREYDRILKQKK